MMRSDNDLPEDLFIAYGKKIEIILRRAVHDALLTHKRAGNPIAVWRDGKVVILPPEEILVDDPLDPEQV